MLSCEMSPSDVGYYSNDAPHLSIYENQCFLFVYRYIILFAFYFLLERNIKKPQQLSHNPNGSETLRTSIKYRKIPI